MESFATTTPIKSEECIELKNIKYKTMLLSGNILSDMKTSHEDLTKLDIFLEQNKTINQNDPWSKLDKTIKTKKLLSFAEIYSKEKEFDEEENKLLVSFLKDCLERKKIQRVKDVTYNKITGDITDIPSLFYNKSNKHFTLKNLDKRVNTLKSLPQKKKQGTIKNKGVSDVEVEEKET